MEANTNEMRRIAKEINTKAVEYQALITKLYKRLSDMPNNNEWLGNKSNEYIKYVLMDKTDMMLFGDKIKSLSNAINEGATIIDDGMSQIRRDEENG